MKKLVLGLLLLATLAVEIPAQKEAPISNQAFLGIDLYDIISIHVKDPVVYWRKMRPQDFVNAPTVWQILA